MTDTELLNWLENCIMNHGGVSASRDWNPMRNEPTFGYLPTMTLFTVPSQHIKAVGLRAVIEAAAQYAAEEPERRRKNSERLKRKYPGVFR
jgi:hypothetical protein